MEYFVKAISMSLITVVLCLFVGKRDKEIATLLSLLACSLLAIAAIRYMKPVFDFFERLRDLGNLDSDLLTILMQVVGVGMLAQIMGTVCSDSGYAAIGRALQVLATAITLCISLPAFSKLIELLEGILQKG